MADPSTAFVPNFSPELVRLFQEMAGGLRETVRTRTITGKSDHWERLGGLALTPVTSRDMPTPYTPGTFTRRRVNMSDFAGSERLDQLDEVKMMINPRDEHTANLRAAWERQVAIAITDAADGNALSVNNLETTATVALPASQTIANGGTGMTMAKLRQANRILDNAGVPRDGRRHILVSSYAIEDLMADSQFTSTDFNAMQAIYNGGAGLINSGVFMGLVWHMISDAIPDDTAVTGATIGVPAVPILPKTGNIRTSFLYHHDAMGLSFAKDATVSVALRSDLSDIWQVLLKGSFGATRILDAGVVTIDYDESV